MFEFDMTDDPPESVDWTPALSKLRPVMDAVTDLARPYVLSTGTSFPWRADTWGAVSVAACAGRLPTDELFVCAIGLRCVAAPAEDVLGFDALDSAAFRLYKIKGGVVEHPARRPVEEFNPMDGTSVGASMAGTGVRFMDFATDYLDFEPYSKTGAVRDPALLDAVLKACPMHPDNRMAEYLNKRKNGKPDDHQFRYVVARHDGQLALFMRNEPLDPKLRIVSKWELVQDSGATIEIFLTDPKMGLEVVKGPSEETLRELKIQKVLNNLAKGE